MYTCTAYHTKKLFKKEDVNGYSYIPTHDDYNQVEERFGRSPEDFWIERYRGSPFIHGHFNYQRDRSLIDEGRHNCETAAEFIEYWKHCINIFVSKGKGYPKKHRSNKI